MGEGSPTPTNNLLDRTIELGVHVLRNVLPARLTREVISQRFDISGPTVVFVKAEGAQISVRRRPGSTVQLDARLYISAGLQVATQQDESGIYIVLLRKRLVGAVSRSNVRLSLPPECTLVADLVHGNLHLDDMSGQFTIPGIVGK